MVVRLTKKLANVVNGLDISRLREGDVIELPARDAQMLIGEGWAEESSEAAPTSAPLTIADRRAVAADRPRRRSGQESDYDELISRLRMGVRASWRRAGDPDSTA